ncbi:MAG: type II secretion system protein [Betaproteobacteria bacterium]|nr:type II secretion system protein [Betaproteobacteria bacterium]
MEHGRVGGAWSIVHRHGSRERGFTYVWIMFAVAIAGVMLAGAGQLWRTEAQREKEKELMFIGEQFRLAVGSYYENSPGMPKRFPPSLEKLLLDDRFPTVKRHLRKIFFDPMTGTREWGLIRQPGIGIVGVHSLSTQAPLKRANFHERYASFSEAKSYEDWEFRYSPGDAEQLSQPQSQPQPQDQPQSQNQPQAQPERGPEAQPASAQPQALPEPFPDPRGPFPADSDSQRSGYSFHTQD